MKIGPGVSELWRVENRPLPLTWPMAYTTACTTVQAVMTQLVSCRPSPIGLEACRSLSHSRYTPMIIIPGRCAITRATGTMSCSVSFCTDVIPMNGPNAGKRGWAGSCPPLYVGLCNQPALTVSTVGERRVTFASVIVLGRTLPVYVVLFTSVRPIACKTLNFVANRFVSVLFSIVSVTLV